MTMIKQEVEYEALFVELAGAALSLPHLLLQLPNDFNTADKYKNFLRKTDTEAKFSEAYNRYSRVLYHADVDFDRVRGIFECIARHLMIVHINKSEELFSVVFTLIERLITFRKRIAIKLALEKVREKRLRAERKRKSSSYEDITDSDTE